MSDDLIARAKAASEGVVIPENWGEVVELEEGGGTFVGRYRGREEDTRGNPVYLFWDEDDDPRFLLERVAARAGDGARGPRRSATPSACTAT